MVAADEAIRKEGLPSMFIWETVLERDVVLAELKNFTFDALAVDLGEITLERVLGHTLPRLVEHDLRLGRAIPRQAQNLGVRDTME